MNKTILVLIALAAVLCLANSVFATTSTFENVISGSAPNSPQPWAKATYDTISNETTITLELLTPNPSFLGNFWISGDSITIVSEQGTFATPIISNSSGNPVAGIPFDWEVSFETSNSQNGKKRFDLGDKITFKVTNLRSTSSYFAAIHVQGLNGNDASVKLGAKTPPTLAVMGSVSLNPQYNVNGKLTGVEVKWNTISEYLTMTWDVARVNPKSNWLEVVTPQSMPAAWFANTNAIYTGGNYSFVDSLKGVPNNAPQTLNYYLIEHETTGRTLIYGPYTVTLKKILPKTTSTERAPIRSSKNNLIQIN